MGEAISAALAGVLVQVIIAAGAVALVWLKVKRLRLEAIAAAEAAAAEAAAAKKQATETQEAVVEIHGMVNQQRSDMMAKIEALESELRVLKKEPP